MNPNSRMVTKPSSQDKDATLDKTNVESSQNTATNADSSVQDETLVKAEEPRPSVLFNKELTDADLLKDVDLEPFYITGKLEYEFKIGNKIPVKIKLISNEDLGEAHALLFKLLNSDSMSMHSVTHEYTSYIVSKILLRYGDTNVAKFDDIEKAKFIKELPSAIISIIYNKYSRYEFTVNRLLNDAEQLKN